MHIDKDQFGGCILGTQYTDSKARQILFFSNGRSFTVHCSGCIAGERQKILNKGNAVALYLSCYAGLSEIIEIRVLKVIASKCATLGRTFNWYRTIMWHLENVLQTQTCNLQMIPSGSCKLYGE